MAYPTVSAPYGLKPINRVDGMPYAGAIRQVPIDSDYNTAIFNGDIVRIAAGGTIEKSTVTTDSTTAAANATYGVFVGVSYTNSMSQPVDAQYYPGNSGVSNAVAFVVDDPMAAFKVAVTFSGNATVTSVNESIVGTNVPVRQGAGSTVTGDSALSVYATNAQGNAAALPLRVVAVVPDTNTSATTYCEVVVKFNNPQILRTTGLDYAA